MKIAMWSGPRNISTAMMYSFGNRKDCAISDEPFYAAYLAATGVEHPMTQEIIRSQETDPSVVAASLLGANPEACPLWYQKHMTHHMLEGYSLDWLSELKNVFLIRNPEKIIASYVKKRGTVDFSDLGFVEQARIFRFCLENKLEPIVLDSDYVLRDSTSALTSLCQNLGINFDTAMTKWEAGSRPEDGVWAAHWYDAVHNSTGFAAAKNERVQIPSDFRPILDQAMPIYEELRELAIT